jgi:hypothetical protein
MHASASARAAPVSDTGRGLLRLEELGDCGFGVAFQAAGDVSVGAHEHVAIPQPRGCEAVCERAGGGVCGKQAPDDAVAVRVDRRLREPAAVHVSPQRGAAEAPTEDRIASQATEMGGRRP